MAYDRDTVKLRPRQHLQFECNASLLCFYCTVLQANVWALLPDKVPVGWPSFGRDVAVYVFDLTQPSLPTPFYCVLVSISGFMALSTGFHSTKSPDNSLLSHSVFAVLFCLIGPFNYISLYGRLLQPRYNPLWLTGPANWFAWQWIPALCLPCSNSTQWHWCTLKLILFLPLTAPLPLIPFPP